MAVNTTGFGAYDIRGIYPESITEFSPKFLEQKKSLLVMTFGFRGRRFLTHWLAGSLRQVATFTTSGNAAPRWFTSRRALITSTAAL